MGAVDPQEMYEKIKKARALKKEQETNKVNQGGGRPQSYYVPDVKQMMNPPDLFRSFSYKKADFD